MRNRNLGSLTRLLGLLGILAVGAVQHPSEARALEDPCVGTPGCWVCVYGCIIFYCNGELWTNCF